MIQTRLWQTAMLAAFLVGTGCAKDSSTEPQGSGESSGGGGESSTGAPVDTDDPEATITYHGHVRALVETHCVRCHVPDATAPFALQTYDELFAVKDLAGQAIADRRMPPYLTDSTCAEYRHDRSMPPEEQDVFAQWIEQGAAVGSPDDYVAPQIPEQPGLSRVDFDLAMPEAYTPMIEPDDYRCFLLDWPEEETSYVTGFRAIPGDLRLVHHIIAYRIPPENAAQFEALEENAEGPGYTCFGGPGGGLDPRASTWLGAWAPGSAGSDYPEGTGLRVEPGSKVALQVHYHPDGVASEDLSTVEFKVEREVDNPAAILLWLDPGWPAGGMGIPPGEMTTHVYENTPSFALDLFTDEIEPGSPFLIHSASHHMHTVGSRGVQAIRHSDGEDECLVLIDDWDFNWQGTFPFMEPRLVEPTDSLYIECEFDNREGSDWIGWGDGTNDEMCLGVFYITAAP